MKGLEHLKSKRYWALILFGPPLQYIFAYAVFAGLHLGLGLPWPTLRDAGLVASLLEVLVFFALLTAVEFLALGRIYRMNFFTRGWSTRKAELGPIEFLASSLGVAAGFMVLVVAARAMPELTGAGFENGGFMIFVVVLASAFTFMGTVQHGERTLRNEVDKRTSEEEA